MFIPSEKSTNNRRTGSSSKWEFVKTFYYDPVKWNFIKSVGFFGVSIYLIRDLASNDLLPMD